MVRVAVPCAIILRGSRLPAFAVMMVAAFLIASPARGAEKLSLQLRWDHQYQFAGYYAALWQGYYANAGLDVEIRSAIGPHRKVLRAAEEVDSGRADFGVGSIDILLARDRGARLTLISPIFQRSPVAIFARAGAGLTSPADLARMRVRRVHDSLADMELATVLRAEGLNPATITPLFPDSRAGRSWDLLRAGKIDAFAGFTFSTMWLARKHGIELDMLRPLAYGIDFYGDSLFGREDMVRKNPELVQRFLAASLKGWRYALENSVQVADRITRELPRGFPSPDAKAQNRFQIDEVRQLIHHPLIELGHVNRKRWRGMHRALWEARLVKNPLDLDELIFDPAREARRQFLSGRRYVLSALGILAVLLAGSSAWSWTSRRAARRAAIAQRESEQHYRTLAEMTPEAVYVQCDGVVVFANRAAADTLGAESVEQIIGRAAIDFFHPDSHKRIRQRRAAMPSDGASRHFVEHRILKLDGTEAIVECTTAPYSWHGKEAGLVVARDISERKRAETALAESEERYRKVVELSPDAIVIHRDRKIAFVNPSAVTMFGARAASDLVGRTAIDLVHPDFHEYVRGRRDQLRAGSPGLPDGRIRFVRLDGSDFLGAPSNALLSWNGEEAFLASIRDITRQEAAEEARRESEERFAAVVNNCPSAIFLKDLSGRYLMVNKRFQTWYGRTKEDLIGKTPADLFDRERAGSVAEHDREVVEKLTAVERERVLRFADGRDHQINVVKFPVLDGDGRAVGIGAFNTDVTEQRNAETMLRQAQRMETVGRLTGGIAHEFNNLLMLILGNVELIEDELPAKNRMAKYVAAAKKGALRGAELTRRMLAFSRSQALEVTRVDLNGLIADMGVMLRGTLGETVAIYIDPCDDLWPTLSDPGQIEGALLNLVINARDAMADGGEIVIRTANRTVNAAGKDRRSDLAPGDYAVLEISDTGPGMTREVREQAFDPFFSTKDVGEGTGLGLSMVYGFAKQSGGGVEIQSEPGQGATVGLYLPRDVTNAPVGEKAVAEESAPRGNGTILVVEDDAAVRAIAVHRLTSLGYDVMEAEDGPAASEHLDGAAQIDLLFTDVVMPGGVSGLDLWRTARQRRPGLKVVFTSGYSDDVFVGEESETDTSNFIRKPYVRSELARAISAALRD